MKAISDITNSSVKAHPFVFIFFTVLPIFIPVFVFFIFNLLTPIWWDDFVLACFFTQWDEPHTLLLSSFSDVVTSTYNMFRAWHGRIVADFLNLFFMFLKDKNIFNICNTIIYGIFVFLMCFHITGSFRKNSALLFMCINILLWFMLPVWGQNFLWLSGSCNYLWTSTIVLAFLIPFRKKIENSSYKPHIIISLLWIIPGIMAGWSLENSAAGVFILLIFYFIFKRYKKEPIVVFEILGSIGFIFGFFMLLQAPKDLFPGFLGLLINAVKVGFSFIIISGPLIGSIILFAIEIRFKKDIIPKAAYGFFIAALGSAAAMIIPGRFDNRPVFITQVFLIITMLILFIKLKQFFPKRYIAAVIIALVMIFVPSFYSGGKSIVSGFLYNQAREHYILSEIQNGNLEVNVKSPIPVSDSHSGMYNAIDILNNPEDIDYIVHNSAKATWYGLKSLTGIPTPKTGITPSILKFLAHRKLKELNINDLYIILYEDWY